jgi:hypothetical protein
VASPEPLAYRTQRCYNLQAVTEAMNSADTTGIYCHHSLERRQLPPRTLHEKMMLEAEPIIQHNWTDVAVHDRDKLQKIPVGHFCYWVVTQMGSFLTPAYCKVSERSKWLTSDIATISPIQMLISRWHGEALKFQSSKAWRRFHDPVQDKHCYLVVKTDNSHGHVIPITYQELAEMAVCKKIPMVTNDT